MSRRKIADIIWLALVYAKQDRLTLADAYDNDKKQEAVRQANADYKAFTKLQMKLFGTTKTKLEAHVESMDQTINLGYSEKRVDLSDFGKP